MTEMGWVLAITFAGMLMHALWRLAVTNQAMLQQAGRVRELEAVQTAQVNHRTVAEAMASRNVELARQVEQLQQDCMLQIDRRAEADESCRELMAQLKHMGEERQGLLDANARAEESFEKAGENIRSLLRVKENLQEALNVSESREKDLHAEWLARVNHLDAENKRLLEADVKAQATDKQASETIQALLGEREKLHDKVQRSHEETKALRRHTDEEGRLRNDEHVRLAHEYQQALAERDAARAEVVNLKALVEQCRALLRPGKVQPERENKPPETDEWRVGDEVLTRQGPGKITRIVKPLVHVDLDIGVNYKCYPSELKRPEMKPCDVWNGVLPDEEWKVGDEVTWTAYGSMGMCTRSGKIASLSSGSGKDYVLVTKNADACYDVHRHELRRG